VQLRYLSLHVLVWLSRGYDAEMRLEVVHCFGYMLQFPNLVEDLEVVFSPLEQLNMYLIILVFL
jgi:hypothetical protein